MVNIYCYIDINENFQDYLDPTAVMVITFSALLVLALVFAIMFWCDLFSKNRKSVKEISENLSNLEIPPNYPSIHINEEPKSKIL